MQDAPKTNETKDTIAAAVLMVAITAMASIIAVNSGSAADHWVLIDALHQANSPYQIAMQKTELAQQATFQVAQVKQ